MELRDLLDALDVNVADGADLQQIKDAFHSKYVSREIAIDDRDIVAKIKGKHVAFTERKLAQSLRDVGIELPEGFTIQDLDDAGKNPIFQLRNQYEQQINDLKSKAAKSNDSKVRELEEARMQLERDLSSYKEIATNLEREVENTKLAFVNEKKSWLINQHKQQAFSQFTLSDTVDEYKRKGFDVTFNEKYRLDIDGDTVVVMDTQGNKVLNEKKSGHATLQEVLKMELDAANMLKKNNTPANVPAAGYQAQPIQFQPRQQNTLANEKGYVSRSGNHSERLQQARERQ